MKRQRAKPVLCQWDGEHFVPHARFAKLCDQQFVVGEDYPLEVVENRSLASHNAYFAAIAEGWHNLSEENAVRFPGKDGPEKLRAWCLVQCGYCSQEETVLDTPSDARKYANLVRRSHPYVVIRVRGNVVQVFTPRSQAMYGPERMKKQEFEDSKRDVLDLVASMSRTTRSQLNRESRRYGR